MKNKNKYIIGGIIAVILFLKWRQKKKNEIAPTEQANNSNDYSNDYRSNFVNLIKQDCIDIGKNIGVPYKFLIAQLVLETGWGRSKLFTKYNNIGGIKAVAGQKFISLKTFEYRGGVKKLVSQNFAVYETKRKGIEAYEKVLKNKYFSKYLNKTIDPLEYVKLLQSGAVKYASSPFYINSIKDVLKSIEQFL
jgi:flagellum-specific peptidoglycan hydrolase FlgJ